MNSDVEYASLSGKDTRVATARGEHRAPTLEQIGNVIGAMPSATEAEPWRWTVAIELGFFTILAGPCRQTGTLRLGNVTALSKRPAEAALPAR